MMCVSRKHDLANGYGDGYDNCRKRYRRNNDDEEDCSEEDRNEDHNDHPRDTDPSRLFPDRSASTIPDLTSSRSSALLTPSKHLPQFSTRSPDTPPPLPASENISAILCKIDDRNDVRGAHFAMDMLCVWIKNSTRCTNPRSFSSTMNEFYELAGVQRILNCLEFINLKAEEYVKNEGAIRYDDPSMLTKICFILSSCSQYSRKMAEKIVIRGGVESLITLNERYLDTIVLCPTLGHPDRMKLEWGVVFGTWEIFRFFQNLSLGEEDQDRLLDASLDTLEYLHGVEVSHSIMPHVLCRVFATIHDLLCRGTSPWHLRTRTRINRNRIVAKCLLALKHPITGDWREFPSEIRDEHGEIALLKSVVRFLIDFVAPVRQQKQQQQQQQQQQPQLQQQQHHPRGEPNASVFQSCRDGGDLHYQHVIEFGVDQILKSPSRARVVGAFSLIVRLCQTMKEKRFLRHYTGLTVMLGTILESDGTDPILKNACENLLKHIYQE